MACILRGFTRVLDFSFLRRLECVLLCCVLSGGLVSDTLLGVAFAAGFWFRVRFPLFGVPRNVVLIYIGLYLGFGGICAFDFALIGWVVCLL